MLILGVREFGFQAGLQTLVTNTMEYTFCSVCSSPIVLPAIFHANHSSLNGLLKKIGKSLVEGFCQAIRCRIVGRDILNVDLNKARLHWLVGVISKQSGC